MFCKAYQEPAAIIPLTINGAAAVAAAASGTLFPYLFVNNITHCKFNRFECISLCSAIPRSCRALLLSALSLVVLVTHS